jgi:predicted glycosyltransferase involved in capsule biosynthesis
VISFLVPYRPDEERDRLFSWVHARLKIFSKAQIVIRDSEGEEFNRARARNLAAKDSDGDVLVFVDADSVFDFRPFLEAVHLVLEKVSWALPYTEYFNLTPECSEGLLARDPATVLPEYPEYIHRFPSAETPEPAVAGCVVVRRDAFESVGGYDESFRGWGLEDRVFAMALHRKFGEATRVEGPLCHLWHSTPVEERFGQPHFEHNRALYRNWCALLGFEPIC